MMMLTKQNRKDLPKLYANDGQGEKAMAIVKFFTPDSNWTWYASEFDGNDTFYGLVVGQYVELGYFYLSELESARGPWGLKVERDRHFKPQTIGELRAYHNRMYRRE